RKWTWPEGGGSIRAAHRVPYGVRSITDLSGRNRRNEIKDGNASVHEGRTGIDDGRKVAHNVRDFIQSSSPNIAAVVDRPPHDVERRPAELAHPGRVGAIERVVADVGVEVQVI